MEEIEKKKKVSKKWVIDPNKTLTFRQIVSGAFMALGGFLIGDGEGVLGFGCIIFGGLLLAIEEA
ncbi:MAG: hypothetical protein AMQ74_01735 [Candidatus Methanofastidiosum methylothiophilum]|uniref:Uncharacterized protein n=1 Tax=Candidatus Methanofastidiosum methylothiophilum TaxID=1705564 RepID=A0A150IQK0_9EURY|nr:MAG: hypothetical protein AMQ74_01735 [Candidatus Methanofastidiosum methylthiophilus]